MAENAFVCLPLVKNIGPVGGEAAFQTWRRCRYLYREMAAGGFFGRDGGLTLGSVR